MTDAPKIDTQAPERLRAFAQETKTTLNGVSEQIADDIIALLDLSAAREAAAWMAGRDAVIDRQMRTPQVPAWAEVIAKCLPLSRSLTPPTAPAAALDRLIAERVREAVEAEREACATLIDDRCKEILDKQDGTIPQVDTNLRMMAILLPDLSDVIRSRGSKEGRDG